LRELIFALHSPLCYGVTCRHLTIGIFDFPQNPGIKPYTPVWAALPPFAPSLFSHPHPLHLLHFIIFFAPARSVARLFLSFSPYTFSPESIPVPVQHLVSGALTPLLLCRSPSFLNLSGVECNGCLLRLFFPPALGAAALYMLSSYLVLSIPIQLMNLYHLPQSNF